MFDGAAPFSAVIAFFVVLIPLILVHELGHFLAAKAVGITVLEFGIGFPPRIVKLFTWGETEFTLNWIQLGGFVRPLGEDMIRPVDQETVEQDRQTARERSGTPLSEQEEITQRGLKNPKAVNEVRPLGRIFFMAAGALANFLLAFLLFMVIALIGLPQPVGGSVFLLDVPPNSVFSDAGLQGGDFILDINGEHFNDSQAFFNRLYSSDEPATVSVQRGNSPEEFTVTIPDLDGNQPQIGNYALLTNVVQDAPAGAAGLQPGDIVVAFNGQPISSMDDFRVKTAEHAGELVQLTIRRDNEEFDVELTPRTNPPAGQGAIGIQIQGVALDRTSGLTYQEGFIQEVLVPQRLDTALRYGIDRVASVISLTVQIPAQLVSGALTAEEARPVSVVGMSQIGAVVIERSIQQQTLSPILDFIGVISVALGFFNLLPIPALDGGRIMFVLLEMVRGRPIAPEREGLVHLIGLALLLSLSVLVILNDVMNPIMLP